MRDLLWFTRENTSFPSNPSGGNKNKNKTEPIFGGQEVDLDLLEGKRSRWFQFEFHEKPAKSPSALNEGTRSIQSILINPLAFGHNELISDSGLNPTSTRNAFDPSSAISSSSLFL